MWCEYLTGELRDTIARGALGGLKSNHSEEAKVKHLYDAFSGIDLTNPALTQYYRCQTTCDFQKLYSAQYISWLQEQCDAKNT